MGRDDQRQLMEEAHYYHTLNDMAELILHDPDAILDLLDEVKRLRAAGTNRKQPELNFNGASVPF